MLTEGLADVEGLPFDTQYALNIPLWMRERYHSADPLARYDRSTLRLGIFMFVGALLYMMLVIGWIVATSGSPVYFGFPTALIPLLLFGLTGWSVRAFAQAPSIAERGFAAKHGIPVFAVGLIPASKTYLVVQRTGIQIVFGRGNEVAHIGWSTIDIAILRSSQFGVGISLSVDGEWYDLPLVVEAGGVSAAAWSWEGFGAKKRFFAAVNDLLKGHVPTYVPTPGESAA